MYKVNNSIVLGIGNVSFSQNLGCYYQDYTQAIIHFEAGRYCSIDEKGIPYWLTNGERVYNPILVIQYAMIAHDFILKGADKNKHYLVLASCLDWLETRLEILEDAFVLRNPVNEQYGLQEGWVGGMVQGQAISVFLRSYQLFNNQKYLAYALKIFISFNIGFERGGFKRIDEKGCLWFEEYPTKNPSYVLNGFIYAMFGVLDLYRVTKNPDVYQVWEMCILTLEKNISKYDVWYWSVYDQLKKQLVSYYYQKNVHIPLMKILYQLTGKVVFGKYERKWKWNLNNKICLTVTSIMYRVRPRFLKIVKLLNI